MRYFVVDIAPALKAAAATGLHVTGLPHALIHHDSELDQLYRSGGVLQRRCMAATFPIEEWELLTRDNQVLRRTGQVDPKARRIVWRKQS